MESVKKILLTDLSFWGGHHETYFMEILSILSEKYTVYACCVENDKLRKNINQNQLKNCQVIDLQLSILDKIFLKFLKILDQALNPILKHTSYPVQFTSLFHLVATKRLMREIGEDVPVFFANTDSAMPAVPLKISNLFMPSRWVGLQVLPSYQSKLAFGKIKSRTRFYAEKNFSLKSCRGILVLHPIYKKFFKKRFSKANILYLPELIQTSFINEKINLSLIEEISKIAQGKIIVSLLGELTGKKNLLLFLESLALLDKDKYFGLILGRLWKLQHSKEEIDRIKELQEITKEQLYCNLNYFIANDAEFNEIMKLSNIIFLCYRNHPFSSNLLTKAINFKKPVIVNKGYLMEKTVRDYHWRDIVEENPNAVAESICSLSYDSISNGKYLDFIQSHSHQSFKSSLLKACQYLK